MFVNGLLHKYRANRNCRKEFYLAEYTCIFIYIRGIKMEQDLHFQIVLIMSLKALVVLIFMEAKGLEGTHRKFTIR